MLVEVLTGGATSGQCKRIARGEPEWRVVYYRGSVLEMMGTSGGSWWTTGGACVNSCG
jgi:hypothetical protein